jgi:hypothetical protein
MKPTHTLLTTLCIAVIGMFSAQAADTTARMWTDTKGRQVEATFGGLDGEMIVLQTKDGNTHRFPLTNLSAEDQQIAKTMKAPNAGTTAINASVAQAAAKIDVLVAKGVLRANPDRTAKGLPPITSYNPLTSDEQFVRRVYLDVIGRIPNYDEATAFIKDTSPTKRAKLIDQLLDSPGYVSTSFNYFADMLRVKDNFDQGNQVRGRPYINWLKEQISANRPWNEMVADMIKADGKLWHNGAAGYLLRDSGMPLDNLANTLTIFLGTDVACAQCHDHPFASWTQMQFYEMASFFGATTTLLNRNDFENGDPQMRLMPEIEKIVEANGMDIRDLRNGLNQFIGANRASVQNRKENMLKLPHDYQYKDGKGGDYVAPKFITWTPSDKSNPAYKQSKKNEERLRDSFANWMTHKDNPRFAMSIANRLWKRAFGSAVAEPVINIDDPAKASNPELLLHLTAEMKRLNFNLKDFMRLIYNTKAYQAEATTEALAMGEHYYFQGPQLRRMSAEQAWDSYMGLMTENPDDIKRPAPDLYGRAIDLDLNNPKLDAQTVLMKYSAYRNMGQTEMEMMNAQMSDEDGDTMMMDDTKKKGGYRMARRGGGALMRASEMEQPARAGHFLTEFGQSQRLLIDGGSRVGSVPQVLMMMNGNAQEMLTNQSSTVLKKIGEAESLDDKTDILFMSLMNRQPTAKERELAKKETDANGSYAWSNMVWALLNTREFIFIQ